MKFLAALMVSMLALVASITPTTAQDDDAAVLAPVPAAEDAFVAHLNAARAEAGLEPLRRDDGLIDAARGWARWMGERRDLRHADDIVTGAPADWTKAGENVGRGGTVDAVWEAFMASPSHAANVLDPAFTRIGVGVVQTSDGIFYTAHRFAGAVSDQAPAPPPPTPEETDPPPPPDPGSAPVDLDAPPPIELAFADDDAPGDDEPTSSADTPTVDPRRLAATMRILLAASS
ncbi:MAG: CAP domain-containing protein [Acidimicrobiales bacterium]